MKFSAVLFSATAVSATTLFKVTEFSAGCTAHSSLCNYSFKLVQNGNGETVPVTCKTTATAQNNSKLPAVSNVSCENSARTFSVAVASEGLTLSVTQPVSRTNTQTGKHLLPISDFTTSTEPNAQVQTYTGTTSFNLDE